MSSERVVTLSSDSQTTVYTLPVPDTLPPGFRTIVKSPRGDMAWQCVWDGKHAFWEYVNLT